MTDSEAIRAFVQVGQSRNKDMDGLFSIPFDNALAALDVLVEACEMISGLVAGDRLVARAALRRARALLAPQ